jgi:hypothetical protein
MTTQPVHYGTADFVSRPLACIVQWCDDYAAKGWMNEGYLPNRRQRFAQRAATYVRGLRAVVYVWVARNGDEWTFWLACKANLCLLLGLRGAGKKRLCSAYIAWFSEFEHEKAPSCWYDVEVGAGVGNWYTRCEYEMPDMNCP